MLNGALKQRAKILFHGKLYDRTYPTVIGKSEVTVSVLNEIAEAKGFVNSLKHPLRLIGRSAVDGIALAALIRLQTEIMSVK